MPTRVVGSVSVSFLVSWKENRSQCWNPSLRHRRWASIRLAGNYGYSDTRTFVTEKSPTSYSRVDYILEYINHVNTMLVLHQLAAIPIELPSCTRNLIVRSSQVVVSWKQPDDTESKMWSCIMCKIGNRKCAVPLTTNSAYTFRGDEELSGPLWCNFIIYSYTW
jgi:hypothetical protein